MSDPFLRVRLAPGAVLFALGPDGMPLRRLLGCDALGRPLPEGERIAARTTEQGLRPAHPLLAAAWEAGELVPFEAPPAPADDSPTPPADPGPQAP